MTYARRKRAYGRHLALASSALPRGPAWHWPSRWCCRSSLRSLKRSGTAAGAVAVGRAGQERWVRAEIEQETNVARQEQASRGRLGRPGPAGASEERDRATLIIYLVILAVAGLALLGLWLINP